MSNFNLTSFLQGFLKVEVVCLVIVVLIDNRVRGGGYGLFLGVVTRC